MAKIAEQASALLAQASAALADGDEDVALEALVAAWRVARHDAIAAVIARLSARLEPHVAPLGGRLPEFHAAWMAMGRSGRAVYLPRLVGSVLHSTHRFGTAVVEALLARGELLSAWPADPRLAALVVEHLRRPGYESTSRSTLPFWRVLFAILGAHGDAQTLAFLQDVRFARTFRSFSDGKRRIAWFQQHADEARAELASRLGARAPAPARSALDATVAKIDKALGARAKSAPEAEVIARLAAAVRSEPPAPPTRARAGAKRPPEASARPLGELLREASKAKADAEQLAALLEAWRVAPAAELAQLVEAVSQRITARLPPIRGASRAATHQAWLAVAARADPCDLPRLLRSITDTKGRSTDALARLQALAGWPADPRAANGVLAQLAVPAFHSSSSRPFWSALIDWAVAHGDPRAADAFEALGARYDVILATRYADRSATASWFRRQLHSAAARLRELAAVTLSKADQRTIERLAKRLGDGDAPYLERIYADLESDEPRQAFADHLLERGDPRGELIALQLSGGDRERAAALVGDHAHAWVGGLAPFLNLEHCRFERGFVDHVEIAGFEPQSLGPVLHDPVWATVRTIHLVAVEPSRFTASAAMRALEKVTINARRGRRAIRIVAG